MKKKLIALFLLITLTIGLTSCENTYLNSTNPSEQLRVNYERLGDGEIIEYYKQAEEYATKVDTNVVQLMNQIGFDLLKASKQTDINMISPVGSYLSLSLLYSAVSGEAKNEFDEILRFGQTDNSERNTTIHDLLLYLYRIDANTNITYANSVYVPKSITGSDSFLVAATKYLFSRMTKIDFTNQEAVLDEVNQWATNYTSYRFDSILDQLEEDTKALSLNAFHYEALTTTEFLAMDYFPDEFYGTKTTSNVDYMRAIGNYGFYENGEVEVIEVPLGRKKTSIYFIIPQKNSSKDLLATLTTDELNAYMTQTANKSMELTIPQMTLETTNNMNELLTELGASSIVTTPGSLNGLSEDTTITQYINKVGLTLDRTDTNISQIDVLNEMNEDIIMEYEEYIVNKPFLFVIKDHETGANIMVGSIDNMGY